MQSTGSKPSSPARGHFLQPKWGEGAPWGQGSLRERFEEVAPHIKDGRILDIGCASRYGKSDWMHGLLVDRFGDVTGMDINEKTVAEMNAAGFRAVVGNAEHFDLGQQFDTIFGGEVIEHLGDIAGFLRSVIQHLAPGGCLVLTTPNAFYIGNTIYRWGGHALVHPEHTHWHDQETLRNVLTRTGFHKVEISYFGHNSPTTGRRVATKIARTLLSKQLAYDYIIAVAYVGD